VNFFRLWKQMEADGGLSGRVGFVVYRDSCCRTDRGSLSHERTQPFGHSDEKQRRNAAPAIPRCGNGEFRLAVYPRCFRRAKRIYLKAL